MSEETALDDAYIEKKMKQFKLVDMRSGYLDLINEAEQESLLICGIDVETFFAIGS